MLCDKRCCRDSYSPHALHFGAKGKEHLEGLIESYDMHGAMGCIIAINAGENGKAMFAPLWYRLPA